MAYFDDIAFVHASLDVAYDQPFDRRWPSIWSVQFVFQGRMYCGRDGRAAATLSGPAIYWIDPRHTYQLGTVDRRDRRHYVIFRGPRARRIVQDGFDAMAPEGFLPVQDAAGVDRIFRGFAERSGSPSPVAHAECVLLLEQLLLLLMQDARPAEASAAQRTVIEDAAGRLRAHPFARHDLRQLARDCHLSYSHFRRRFREVLQRSPYDYLLLCRMQAAADMLRDKNRQVKEVANAAGYEDSAQFSRAFRRSLGLSPREFRQTM